MSLPNLNLLNFELPQTCNCKYILTSPRSLKACRKAGVKPLDLLYKSLNEVEKELGQKEGVQEKYQVYESQRQQKLALCRKLRNDLILMGIPGRTDSQKSNDESKINITPRKTVGSSTSVDHDRNSGEISESIKSTDSKNIASLRISTSSQSVSKNHVTRINQGEHVISQLLQSYSPEKKTIGTSSNSSLSAKTLITSLPPANYGVFDSTLLEKIPKENVIKSDLIRAVIKNDSSIENLDLMENNANIMKTEEIPDRKGVHFNNHHGTFLEKKPCIAFRKKIREKKKLKALEYERLYNNICSQYADPQYCLRKYKHVIENSLERELREQEVHRVQRELEEGLERWQDELLVMQWLDSLRAQEQTAKEIETKVERLQRRARSKNILHTMNYNKVKRDEDIKAEILRRFVEDKERKIINLNKQRQRVIYESKTRAQNISELKEQIRNILMPETFDIKIIKCGLQRKLLNTKIMCPKIMHHSHVRLA